MEQEAAVGQLSSITWEAPEHNHVEKSGEWYAILIIISLAGSATAFAVGNLLFGILIILFAIVATMTSMTIPDIIPYSITQRGVRVNDRLYPFSELESYYIEEEDINGPQLLLKGQRFFSLLVVIPIPEEDIDDIEELIAARLPEEHLEEPFLVKVMEFFGF